MSSRRTDAFLQHVSLDDAAPAASAGHPFDVPAIHALRQGVELTAPITFLVGENGSGKSTVIEGLAIACGFNAEGGSRNLRFDTRQTQSVLHRHLRLRRSISRPRTGFFLRAESFYNMITALEELDAEPSDAPPLMPVYTGVPNGSLHEQSHGESFWNLLLNRFSADGLYFLDEPESALSPLRQMAAMRRFHDLATDGSQFVIATHSPLLLAYPQASILLLDDRGITPTFYEDLPLVRIYRGILANPTGVMRELMKADDDA